MVAAYIQGSGVSDQLKRVWQPTGIRWVNKAEPWEWKVCSGLRDQVLKEKTSGVVYEVQCDDCQASYMREMLRSLKACVDKHRQQSKPGARFDIFEVVEHVVTTGHQMNWDGTRIMDSEMKWHSRKVKEAFCTLRLRNRH